MSELALKLSPEESLQVDEFGELRQGARRALMQHGFPDLKTEEWKYTSLRVLQQREFQAASASASQLPKLPFDACVLHFDNGVLDPDAVELIDGITLEPAGPDDLGDASFGGREDAFAWLNLASFSRAWKLRISGEPSRPLVLAFSSADDFSAAVHPRLLIELADNARATIVEIHSGSGEGMTNSVANMKLGQGAGLSHVFRCSDHQAIRVGRTRVDVGRDAEYKAYILDSGARLGRQDLQVFLNAAGAQTELDGTVLLDTRQHVDYHTAVDHCTGHTESREMFRYLADGAGVGVFNGRIHIHEDADDSHSDMSIASLLLGPMARINAKPELEIYSEEVTASHGATIGQLDDDALFYLRSRGMTDEDANALLKYGFASAPLENMADEAVRNWLLEELRQTL